MMTTEFPPWPYREQTENDYKHDLDLAKLSRAVYASRDEIIGSHVTSSVEKPFQMADNYTLLGNDIQDKRNFLDDNTNTGLVAAAFEYADRQRVVVAFRGSDNPVDNFGNTEALNKTAIRLPGTVMALAADSDISAEIVSLGDPLSQGPGRKSREQLLSVQQSE
jgi:hypothetical protein